MGKVPWAEWFSRKDFPLPQNPSAEFIMSTYYWDLYVLYIKNCERENYINDIDPNHYYMEWNHFWPRCIFGEWAVGQWLTLKQHAIVSALQTLVFKKNCMCAWHKKYLPPNLLALAWPYFCKASSETASKLHAEKDENGKSLHNLKLHAEKDENGKSLHNLKLHEEKDKDGKSLHAKKGVKKVLVTFPDGSQHLFNSLTDAGLFLNVPVSTIGARIKSGPSRYKSKLAGYRFEYAGSTVPTSPLCI
jgi:hypothetical protein